MLKSGKFKFKSFSLLIIRMSRRRRSSDEIATEILDHAESGIKKTQIMYQCNLSFTQLENYTKALINAGFMTVNGGIYRNTTKGKDVLHTSRELKQKMEPFYRFLKEEQSI